MKLYQPVIAAGVVQRLISKEKELLKLQETLANRSSLSVSNAYTYT